MAKYFLAAILVAGGVVGTWYFYPGNEVGLETVLPEQVQLEKDVADKVVLFEGKRLRMTGLPSKEALVEETEVGRFVVYSDSEVTDDAMCNILFWGVPERVEGQTAPKIPAFSGLYKIAQPVPVGVCDWKKSDPCLWNCLFKGRDCLTVVADSHYLASDTAELLSMEKTWKEKGMQMKKVEGEPVVETFMPYNETGMAGVVELLMTHSWAGLDDLNFQPAFLVCEDEKGEKCNFKKKLRYNPNKYVNAKTAEEGLEEWTLKVEAQKAAAVPAE
jgi:hypothetical protein